MKLFKKKKTTTEKFNCHGLSICQQGRDIVFNKASHLVNEIRNLVSTPQEIFDRIYQNTVYNFAECYQDMPWNKEGAPYDLLSQQLNLCISTLKLRRSLLLPQNGGVESIAEQEPKWTYVFFIASLLFQISSIQEDRQLIAFNNDGNCEGTRPLFLGFSYEPNLYYNIEWKKSESTLPTGEFISFFLNRIIDSTIMNWLFLSPRLFKNLWQALTDYTQNNIVIETIYSAAEFNKYQIRKSPELCSNIKLNNDTSTSTMNSQKTIPNNQDNNATLELLLNKTIIHFTKNNEPTIRRIHQGLFINIESLKDFIIENKKYESTDELINGLSSNLISKHGDYLLEFIPTKPEDRRIFKAIVIKSDCLNDKWKKEPINRDICLNLSIEKLKEPL